MKLKKFLVAGWLSAVAVEAGAVAIFADAPSYSAAVGSELFLVDFDPSPPGGAIVDGASLSPHATFGSPEAADSSKVIWSSNAITDAGSTVALNSVGPLSIDFTMPVFAFSLDFSSAGVAQTVELYDIGGGLIDFALAPNASGFFGVRSDIAIDTAIVRNGLFSPGNRDRYFIDNLRAHGVPEPSTWLLVMGGLIALTSWGNGSRRGIQPLRPGLRWGAVDTGANPKCPHVSRPNQSAWKCRARRRTAHYAELLCQLMPRSCQRGSD